MNKSPIVDIYCRSAVNGPEARTTLEQQETACRLYCHTYGLSVGMVHYDVSPGNTYREREQLGVMRRRYRDGSIQGVVVTTLDRLSRYQIHLIILMQEMETHNVVLYCVNESVENEPMARFVHLMLDTIADVEREKTLDPAFAPSRTEV